MARGIGDVAQAGALGLADITVAPLADVAQSGLKFIHGAVTGDVRDLVPMSTFGGSVVTQGAGTVEGLKTAAINTAMVSPLGMVYGAYQSSYDLTTNAMAGNLRGATAAGLGLGLAFAGARAMGPVELNADLLPRLSAGGPGAVWSQRGVLRIGDAGRAGAAGRQFVTSDPGVGEIIAGIEARAPGTVKQAEIKVFRPDGSPYTDFDIVTNTHVIPVKVGGGKGIVPQIQTSQQLTDLPVIGFDANGIVGSGQSFKPSVMKNAQQNGVTIVNTIDDLMQILHPGGN